MTATLILGAITRAVPTNPQADQVGASRAEKVRLDAVAAFKLAPEYIEAQALRKRLAVAQTDLDQAKGEHRRLIGEYEALLRCNGEVDTVERALVQADMSTAQLAKRIESLRPMVDAAGQRASDAWQPFLMTRLLKALADVSTEAVAYAEKHWPQIQQQLTPFMELLAAEDRLQLYQQLPTVMPATGWPETDVPAVA